MYLSVCLSVCLSSEKADADVVDDDLDDDDDGADDDDDDDNNNKKEEYKTRLVERC
jgi:hypothetical protein